MMKKIIKEINDIHNWSLVKKRKFFWSFTLIWSLFIYLIGGEWLYFIPFLLGDIIFWRTLNYTFWKKRKKEKKKKTILQSWGDAILFAVIAATLLRTFLIEAYTIPTPSMEKSLLVGDYLFVSKLAYGPRVPMTPIAFPLVHHTLPIIGGKSYSEVLNFPYYRMSGLGKIERNDCVVFNWPAEREGRPIDKKENYIKRCIGLPGDKIEIINGDLFINDKLEDFKDGMNQRKYFVRTRQNINMENLYEKFDIYPYRNNNMLGDIEEIESVKYDEHAKLYKIRTNRNRFVEGAFQQIPAYAYKGYVEGPNYKTFIVNTTHKTFKELQKSKYIDTIWTAGVDQKMSIFNHQFNPDNFLYNDESMTPYFKWDEENYGPITIPKKGEKVKITSNNLPLYEPIIKRYEGEEMQELNKIDIIKQEIEKNGFSEYQIKMNYYWLMGDNRQNSADSRFWGYVPENHIVGKSLFIWMSYDKYGKGIRWSRMYKPWMWTGIIIIFFTLIKKIYSWKQKRNK